VEVDVRAVIQRVSSASVMTDGGVVGEIGAGLVVLIGVERGDGLRDVEVLVDKLTGLRIFAGGGGGFERSIVDVDGSLLVVSQFTLPASLQRGRRPSFTASAPAEDAEALLAMVVDRLRGKQLTVETGSFGALMSVRMVNEGPATFVLDVRDGRVC
jgi:D-tyrosyl-tRNA(Tyr) deacylase